MTIVYALRNTRGTAADWASANPVLGLGQIGIETDTGREKVGDGVTQWNSLPYLNIDIAFGTTAGTAAQGNDSRIVGAMQKSANGSDAANAGTFRANTHVPILAAAQAVGYSNVSLASPGATFNGFTLTNSGTDQVLLTAQTTGSQNGPWVWNGAASALTRPTDYPSAGVVKGRAIQISNGSGANDDGSLWVLLTATSITVDTTATTWQIANRVQNDARYSGSGFPTNIVTKTAAYTAAVNDFVEGDCTAGGFSITLPSNPTVGKLVAVKKTDATTNTLTILPQTGGSIDVATSVTTQVQGAGAVFEFTGQVGGFDTWAVASVMSSSGPPGATGPTGAIGATGATGAGAVAPSIFDPGSLSSLLSTGGAITSLPVNALPWPMASADVVILNDWAGHTQVLTLTAPALLGATSLTVSSFTPNFAYPSGSPVIPSTLSFPSPIAGHVKATAIGGGGGGQGGGAAALTSGTSTQVGGAGSGDGAVATGLFSVTLGQIITVKLGGIIGTPGVGGAASSGATGNAGTAGTTANTTAVVVGSVTLSAPGGSHGSAGGANSAATVGGGMYGGASGTSTTFGAIGAGGQANNANGVPGGPPLGLVPRGGSGGAPASATNGGLGGNGTTLAGGGSGTTSGTTPPDTTVPGQGGDGGGGGAPGGAGGNGSRGGLPRVILEWTP